MTTCTSFSLFSSLPTELRLRTWSFNLPDPRLVTLHYTSPSRDPTFLSTRGSIRGCASTACILINLQINKETRAHTQKHYRLSFSLPHGPPKIWFDIEQDVLFFPAKEGWLGSWNHFVNAVTMIEPHDLGKVKRLAVSEALFRGVRATSPSPNVRTSCVKEFWEYVRKKLGSVEEVVIVSLNQRREGEDDARAWMADVLGCILSGRYGGGFGSGEEGLVMELQKGAALAEEESGWVAPRWDVLQFPGTGIGSENVDGWPRERLVDEDAKLRHRETLKVVGGIVTPHRKASPKEGEGFWMGGELPFWHYLASKDKANS